MTPPDQRARRSDARRNYDLLVMAAREVFDELGVDTPLEEVARRAGLGNATLYRHFAARHELIVAAYADEVTALCARAGTLSGELNPADALFRWLHAFVGHVATKRELALVLTAGSGGALFDRWYQAMRGTTAALLARAQRAGVVRQDVDAADVVLLACGIALADAARRERLLDVLRSGTVRPGGA